MYENEKRVLRCLSCLPYAIKEINTQDESIVKITGTKDTSSCMREIKREDKRNYN